MTNVRDYSTSELERLTTLTAKTARPTEYLCGYDVIAMRTKNRMVFSDGSEESFEEYINSQDGERRVVSFTDPTEIDPPQADMLAELARRKMVFTKGQIVVFVGGSKSRGTRGMNVTPGHLATVTADCFSSDTTVYLRWDKRVDADQSDGNYPVDDYRLATPEDISAFDAKIDAPNWVVYRVLDASKGDRQWTVERHAVTGAFRCNCPSYTYSSDTPKSCKHCRRFEYTTTPLVVESATTFYFTAYRANGDIKHYSVNGLTRDEFAAVFALWKVWSPDDTYVIRGRRDMERVAYNQFITDVTPQMRSVVNRFSQFEEIVTGKGL